MTTIGYKKFLVLISFIIIISGVYLYFYNDENLEAADSPLSSSLNKESSNTDSSISKDTAFLSSLSSLKNIKIDTSLFTSKSFLSLRDNSVSIEFVEPGRPNPFAPADTNSTVSKDIITSEPSQITSTGAILNGSIDAAIEAQSVYFEYGPTQALGKITNKVEKSMIGSFVTSISSLTPKTTYYYRAVAKVNNVNIYGEIVSFTTN